MCSWRSCSGATRRSSGSWPACSAGTTMSTPGVVGGPGRVAAPPPLGGAHGAVADVGTGQDWALHPACGQTLGSVRKAFPEAVGPEEGGIRPGETKRQNWGSGRAARQSLVCRRPAAGWRVRGQWQKGE